MSERRYRDSDQEEYMSREDFERNRPSQDERRGSQQRGSGDRSAAQIERDQQRRTRGMSGYGPDYGYPDDRSEGDSSGAVAGYRRQADQMNRRPNDFGEGTGGYGNQSGFGTMHDQPGAIGQSIGHGGQGWMGEGPHAGRGPKGYRRSDERILEEVCERLTQHRGIDAGEIEVTVEQGEVTLSGNIDSRRNKRIAEAILDDIPGVVDVHNYLRAKRSDEA